MSKSSKVYKPVLIIRSGIFWLFHALSLIPVVLLLLLFFWAPVKIRYAIGSSWARMNIAFLKLSCNLDYKIKNPQNLPDEASLVLSNHQSTWETLAFQDFLPNQLWVLKKELLRIPVFGWGLALMSPIAIDRSAGKKAIDQIVEQGEEKLTQGRWVIMFPEGTRMAPGSNSKYKMGGFIFASRINHPVVPVAHNAGVYWPKHSFIKYPGTIILSVGEPINAKGMEPDEIKQKIESWIKQELKTIDS